MKNYLRTINAVQCKKCQEVWVLEKGKIDPNIRDLKGDKLSP